MGALAPTVQLLKGCEHFLLFGNQPLDHGVLRICIGPVVMEPAREIVLFGNTVQQLAQGFEAITKFYKDFFIRAPLLATDKPANSLSRLRQREDVGAAWDFKPAV